MMVQAVSMGSRPLVWPGASSARKARDLAIPAAGPDSARCVSAPSDCVAAAVGGYHDPSAGEPGAGPMRATHGAMSHTAIDRYLELLKKSVLEELYFDNEIRLICLRQCIEGLDTYDPRAVLDIARGRPDLYQAHLTQSRRQQRRPVA